MSRVKDPNKDQELRITISTETFIKIGLLILALLILIGLFHKASHALILISVAFFLALALNSPVHRVSKLIPGKLKGNRALATFISFLVVVILIGLFISYIIPPLVKQTENFISAAPTLIREYNSKTGFVGKLIHKYHLGAQIDNFSKQLSNREKNIGGDIFTTIYNIGNSIFAVLTVLVLTYMMLVEGPSWKKHFNKLVPNVHHDFIDRVSGDMYLVIKGYVNGQVVLAAVAAILISPVVFALGISYPIALIVVIFVCGLIPMIGHTIGAVIVTLVALFHSVSAGIIILIYYILYQQFENYVIQPKVQANSTNMSPLLVFASLVIGISLGGLVGGLVAIPVAGCLRIIILEILRTRGDINNRQFKDSTSPPFK